MGDRNLSAWLHDEVRGHIDEPFGRSIPHSYLGAGGTIKEGRIELQGDHADRVPGWGNLCGYLAHRHP